MRNEAIADRVIQPNKATACITLAELEQAINYWRAAHPSSGEERTLSPEVDSLGSVYGEMIYLNTSTVPLAQLTEKQRSAYDRWKLSIDQKQGQNANHGSDDPGRH